MIDTGQAVSASGYLSGLTIVGIMVLTTAEPFVNVAPGPPGQAQAGAVGQFQVERRMMSHEYRVLDDMSFSDLSDVLSVHLSKTQSLSLDDKFASMDDRLMWDLLYVSDLLAHMCAWGWSDEKYAEEQLGDMFVVRLLDVESGRAHLLDVMYESCHLQLDEAFARQKPQWVQHSVSWMVPLMDLEPAYSMVQLKVPLLDSTLGQPFLSYSMVHLSG